MSAALVPPSPEVLAIIQQGSPKSQVQTPAIEVDSVEVQAAPSPKLVEEPQRPAKAKAEKARGDETAGLVSMNFRLPASISPALLKASSDRKIRKIQPSTQQDIVAEALNDWFKRNGYQV